MNILLIHTRKSRGLYHMVREVFSRCCDRCRRHLQWFSHTGIPQIPEGDQVTHSRLLFSYFIHVTNPTLNKLQLPRHLIPAIRLCTFVLREGWSFYIQTRAKAWFKLHRFSLWGKFEIQHLQDKWVSQSVICATNVTSSISSSSSKSYLFKQVMSPHL